MIIIFDLDGVLVNARDIHYEVLNQALKSVAGEKFVISREQHLKEFDGLSTFKKLAKLQQERGLSDDEGTRVWVRKQDLTIEAFGKFQEDKGLQEILKEIKKLDIKIYCASNAVNRSIELALTSLGIREYFDYVLGNDNVDNAKPNPEIYLRCMVHAGVGPNETLIVEDSPVGRQAAKNSKAHTLFVKSREDLTLDNILTAISKMADSTNGRYKNKKLNVLIPMAGLGSRFAQAGFSLPKPLIDVNGKPMIQAVVESLHIDANYIYIVQTSHYNNYLLHYLLNLITPNCKIVQVDGLTCGAACTSLLAQEYINNDSPLLFANSDQIINWNPESFMHSMTSDNVDGGILVFENDHPKWSYAKINDEGIVTEVAEKIPISNLATVGVYYWKHGSDFVRYANQMIDKNIRVNNEFYVCPVYNEAIQDGKIIKTFPVGEMHGLGTPEDLQRYLNK